VRRVLDAAHAPVAAPLDAHQHVADARAGLDAVVHRVLEQRLQHERRQHRVHGAWSMSQDMRRRSPRRSCSMAA
jgi:hypothetical protein